MRISALTKQSEMKLIKKLSDADLLDMIRFEEEVKKGNKTIGDYQEKEKELCAKYHFIVR